MTERATHDDLIATLFDTPGREHINIKLFPGTSTEVSPQERSEAVAGAIRAVDDGEAKPIESFDE